MLGGSGAVREAEGGEGRAELSKSWLAGLRMANSKSWVGQ